MSLILVYLPWRANKIHTLQSYMYAWVGEPDPLPFLCTSTIQSLSIGRAPLPFSPSAASNPRQRRARRYRRNQSSRDLALASPGLSSPGRLQPAAYSISRLAASVKLSPASRNFSKQTSAPPLPDPSCQMAGARDETWWTPKKYQIVETGEVQYLIFFCQQPSRTMPPP